MRAFRQRSPEYVARQSALSSARYRANYRPPEHHLVCFTCGEDFVGQRRGRKYCSDTCRYRQHYLGRYARRVGARREPYTQLEIATRDGWCCGLCDEPVDRGLAYPNPAAASMDHRIPLAKGGDDTPDNVQLAHLLCNWRKNDRLMPDMGLPDRGDQGGRTRLRAEAA